MKAPYRVFFLRSAEILPCPCCQGKLYVIGGRPRTWIQSSGEKAKIIIRRMRCKDCNRVHHELPDLLVPYRRYEAESIELVIQDPASAGVAVDETDTCRSIQISFEKSL